MKPNSFKATDAERRERPIVLEPPKLALDGGAALVELVAPARSLARDERVNAVVGWLLGRWWAILLPTRAGESPTTIPRLAPATPVAVTDHAAERLGQRVRGTLTEKIRIASRVANAHAAGRFERARAARSSFAIASVATVSLTSLELSRADLVDGGEPALKAVARDAQVEPPDADALGSR